MAEGLKQPLRLRLFYWVVEGLGVRHARRRRMREMIRRVPIAAHTTVLDLGGQPGIWVDVPGPLRITILNLPGVEIMGSGVAHELNIVAGDACAVRGEPDHAYDLVFSNSVIEHVGPGERQDAFASEVRRLGRSYWVQTPAVWFPIEAHTGMPFWWFYPGALRRRLLRRWARATPEWAEDMGNTRVLTRKRLQALFPDAQIYVERVMGIPKSYSAWHVGAPRHDGGG